MIHQKKKQLIKEYADEAEQQHWNLSPCVSTHK